MLFATFSTLGRVATRNPVKQDSGFVAVSKERTTHSVNPNKSTQIMPGIESSLPGSEANLAETFLEPRTVKHSPLEFDPAQPTERVSSVDILRGFALMGILLLNINSFGSVGLAHDIPSVQELYGPHRHINFAVLLFKWVFFEGKVRGIFSMLFGAGVLLLTSRAEKRGAASAVADIFTRRNLLLILFGFLHGTFVWDGDILFDYGLSALLFLYPARKLKPGLLIVGGILLSITLGTFGTLQLTHSITDLSLSRQMKAIEQGRLPSLPLSQEDQEVEKRWQDTVAQHTLTPLRINKKIAEAREGYWHHVEDNLGIYFGQSVIIHIDVMPETVAAMLLGMGLFKVGFLTAEAADLTYVLTAMLGFLISVPIYLLGFLHAYQTRFDFLSLDRWIWIPYELTRNAGMLAIAASIMLLIKHGIWRLPQRGLAAVGRTALSNYIGTSLVCQFIFVWGPWKLFGTMEYYQLMYVVLGVWAMNLLFSTLWLRYFQFGPLEWVWRSLTYIKYQPMRKPGQ
jgi:uncharacterized protein